MLNKALESIRIFYRSSPTNPNNCPDPNLALDKLEQRIEALEEARAKMLLLEPEIQFTLEMIRDYEKLARSLRNFPRKSQSMISRGVNQFLLGEYQFNLKQSEFIKTEWNVGKFFLPKSNLKIIYKPLDCFLNRLYAQECCGWKVSVCPYHRSQVNIWITVFLTNPEIREVRWANTRGKEISQLNQWFSNY